MTPIPVPESSFPYGETRAALLLREGLDRSSRERGLSIRKLGKLLGYKQATVLSHMASGRVPIPIERTPDIARQVGLDVAEFLVAALEQRLPQAGALLEPYVSSLNSRADWIAKLEAIADHSLEALSPEYRDVIMEVVSDRAPRRRWLTLAELPTVSEIRKARPNFAELGLPNSDLAILTQLLNPK